MSTVRERVEVVLQDCVECVPDCVGCAGAWLKLVDVFGRPARTVCVRNAVMPVWDSAVGMYSHVCACVPDCEGCARARYGNLWPDVCVCVCKTRLMAVWDSVCGLVA